VAYSLNNFISKELHGETTTVKINWVKNEEDPIFKSGKLIVRMKKEEDQTKNILTATKYALPKIVCPIFRHHIKPSYATTIDLTLLHKLAEKLGNHGKLVFKKYFLNPETEIDGEVPEILQKLIKIDKSGLFTSIFLNELNHIGEGLYADTNTKDRSLELIQFINYLHTLAEREIGEELGEKLIYFSEIFKVSIILLAKSNVANKKGLMPYLRRLNINLEKGSDSIYVIAFPTAFDFLNNFISVIEGNQRVNIDKTFRTKEMMHFSGNASVNICCLRRNKLFTNESFVKKIEASEINVGKIISGTVIDCSIDEALITFLGVDGTIKKSECSWLSYITCRDILKVGDTKEFIIKNIDKSNGNISLSLKLPENDPWKKIEIPKINQIIPVEIISRDSAAFKCIYKGCLELSLPVDEISWHTQSIQEKDLYLGQDLSVKVIKVDEGNKIIECSYRQLEDNPWPMIHESLKSGTEFNGKVHEVTEHFVRVKIDNGLIGKIPKESLIKAGHEYANYRENLVPGQGIDVVVTKVFLNKHWIRLELKRNLN
jgi:predicted RNA-binding protein with RPS1 domain